MGVIPIQHHITSLLCQESINLNDLTFEIRKAESSHCKKQTRCNQSISQLAMFSYTRTYTISFSFRRRQFKPQETRQQLIFLLPSSRDYLIIIQFYFPFCSLFFSFQFQGKFHMSSTLKVTFILRHLLHFFATVLICINGAMLEPEARVFTTPKLQQYQFRKLSLCLLIPDPIPEHTAPSVVQLLFYGAHQIYN